MSQEFDPDESPFEAASIEGMPYKRGSPEDLAIKRILARKAARERGEPVDDDSPYAPPPIGDENLAIERILARKAARERAQDESSTAT